jgi:hypothetical protein
MLSSTQPALRRAHRPSRAPVPDISTVHVCPAGTQFKGGASTTGPQVVVLLTIRAADGLMET